VTDERQDWQREAAASRAIFARQQAADLVGWALEIVWSCERECRFARELVRQSAALRQSAAEREP
jgi:hypothetical protein